MRRSFIALAGLSTVAIVILVALTTRSGIDAASGAIPKFIDNLAVSRANWLSYHDKREFDNTWCGIRLLQHPNDLLIYENLVTECMPEVIIETGTYRGGLSLYLASLLDRWGKPGVVVTIDIDSALWEETRSKATVKKEILERIKFIQGSSTDEGTFNTVADIAGRQRRVMVILDSDHRAAHVLAELELYSDLVSPNSYLIVNDTVLTLEDNESGPSSAVIEFLRKNRNFVVSRMGERYSISCMPSGILRKIK